MEPLKYIENGIIKLSQVYRAPIETTKHHYYQYANHTHFICEIFSKEWESIKQDPLDDESSMEVDVRTGVVMNST